MCTGWSPIRPSKDDKLTDETADQILRHDLYGQRLRCPGFAPKR